jgi:hypothetical protein
MRKVMLNKGREKKGRGMTNERERREKQDVSCHGKERMRRRGK